MNFSHCINIVYVITENPKLDKCQFNLQNRDLSCPVTPNILSMVYVTLFSNILNVFSFLRTKDHDSQHPRKLIK
jgi:hypothetical protein